MTNKAVKIQVFSYTTLSYDEYEGYGYFVRILTEDHEDRKRRVYTTLIADYDPSDGYRSYGGVHEGQLFPVGGIKLEHTFNNVEWEFDGHNLFVNGTCVLSAGTDWYDTYYPSGWCTFSPLGLEPSFPYEEEEEEEYSYSFEESSDEDKKNTTEM